MKKNKYEYLKRSLELLSKWIPASVESMLEHYQHCPFDYDLYDDGYIFCTFCWMEDTYERVVLLVYNDEDVIADCAGVHCEHNTLMNDKRFYDEMSEESDWMYLEHYILSNVLYPDEKYPHCLEDDHKIFIGEALMYTNAYVSQRYRRQGILAMMDSIMRSFVLRKSEGNIRLGCIFSMDPDIACYGEDRKDGPYYYSFDKDEPIREINQRVAMHIGYEPIKLEETESDPEGDGTKLWFCVRVEKDVMLD